MSADIVNLRRARKAKARAAQDKDAVANRRLFGRRKDEKQKAAAERERAARTIEGHRRDKSDA